MGRKKAEFKNLGTLPQAAVVLDVNIPLPEKVDA